MSITLIYQLDITTYINTYINMYIIRQHLV